ncbi:MAG: hypothetical protein [Caudoviricetes sp.]|nr:MAG: hypothetical protein [Caudoviricetes sp.]
MTARVTKTSVTLSTMAANGDKPMDKVVALIVKAQHKAGFVDVTDKIAAGAYRWAVNKGMAPGELVGRKAAAPKTAKEKAVKRMVKETVAKTVRTKAEAVKAVTKSPEEIERIKAANLARMKSVLGKVKQSVRTETDEISFAETDSFAAPAFLTKDEVTALV